MKRIYGILAIVSAIAIVPMMMIAFSEGDYSPYGEWRLETVAGAPAKYTGLAVINETEIRITPACNTHYMPYLKNERLNGSGSKRKIKIEFSSVSWTEMACHPAGRMNFDLQVTKAITDSDILLVDNRRLVFMAGDTEMLTLSANDTAQEVLPD